MKREKHPVDDFFKEALQEHQMKPSDAGRQRFLDEAATIKTNRRRSLWRWFLLLGGLAVVTSAALFLWQSDSEQSAVGSEQFPVGSTRSEVRSQKSGVDSLQQTTGSEQNDPNSSFSRATASSSRPLNSEPDRLENVSQTVGNSATVAAPVPDYSSLTPKASVASKTDVIPATEVITIATIVSDTDTEAIGMTEPVIPQQTPADQVIEIEANPVDEVIEAEATPAAKNPVDSSINLINPDTLLIPEPTEVVEKPKKRKTNSDWHFATSVYYSPEWMFNTLEGDKFVSNFGLEESFRYGRYVLRTGVGLSIAKGTNELMVEYNDYLGSFDQLDSITFNWDERNYHLLPTYYTSDKEVWDSLLQMDSPKVVKRYTYLQIPLILGYDVLQTKHISLGFRAGPVLSLLIQSKQLSGEYDPGKNRIIRINQVTPDRIQTNWQLMGGINLSLPVSKRIGFEIEPYVKYYFNSVYEKSEATKKPWSVGFRASFSIRY